MAFSGYAALEFTPRQYTIGWLLYGASTAVTMWLIRGKFGYPGVSDVEMALVWLFFFLALRSLTLASARFSRLREKLTEKNRQLEESLRQIEELASHDQLTGVLNRGNLLKLLETELRRSERTGEAFCFAMLDLDHFKNVNDTYGHPVGDQVLRKVCEIATQCVRAVDSVGRMGGEEFGILLPSTTLDNGRISLERLREAVGSYDWNSIVQGLAVHLSAGVADYTLGDTLQTITKRADDALYRAKHTGRNKVIAASTPQSSMAKI
jgi:diguanylate cyclase (GGDEF)-like protein